MPIDDRDYFRSRSGRRGHPPACTCQACTTDRLREVQERHRGARPGRGGSSRRPHGGRPPAGRSPNRPRPQRPAQTTGSSSRRSKGSGKRFWLTCVALLVVIYAVFVGYFTYQAYSEIGEVDVAALPGIAAREALTPAVLTVDFLRSSGSDPSERVLSPGKSPVIPPPQSPTAAVTPPDGDSGGIGGGGSLPPPAPAATSLEPASAAEPLPKVAMAPTATATASLTATASPTPKPTLAPLANSFGEIPGYRIIAVSQLGDEPRFWKDGMPFALLGCQEDSRTDDGYYGVSQDGQSSLQGTLTMVKAGFLTRQGRAGGCYEMVVSYQDTKSYCYDGGRYATPGRFVRCGAGTRDAHRFVVSGPEGAVEATWREVQFALERPRVTPGPDHTPAPTVTPTAEPTPTATPTPRPTSTPVPTPTPTPTLLDLRHFVLDLINQDREKHNLRPVALGDNPLPRTMPSR